MISKESAEAIARVLLEQAQGKLNQRKNATARRSHLFSRFSELKRFEPWQRFVITKRCAALVNREPVVVVWFAALFALSLTEALTFRSPILGFRLGLFGVFAWLALLAFYRWRVRQNVRAFVEFVQDRERRSQDAG